MTLEINVTLYSILRQNRFSNQTILMESPVTVDAVLNKLKIAKHEVESVFVNGKPGTFEQELADSDSITFLPLIGGG